jgi:hypothetical protein
MHKAPCKAVSSRIGSKICIIGKLDQYWLFGFTDMLYQAKKVIELKRYGPATFKSNEIKAQCISQSLSLSDLER